MTTNGEIWQRYNHDGTGDRETARRSAAARLAAIVATAGDGLMLPE